MANRKESAYHSLAQMLEAGVHVVNALSTVSSGQSGRLRRAFRKLAQATSQGDSISEAMRRHPWTFTPLEVNIVEAGEKSGNLGFMVQQLADWYRFTNRMGRTMRSGLFLPILMIIACGFLLPFISMIYSMINEGTTIRDYLAAVGRFFFAFLRAGGSGAGDHLFDAPAGADPLAAGYGGDPYSRGGRGD